MPLSAIGKKVLASMKNEYGPDKGEDVFYASENKKRPGSEKWTVKGELRNRAGRRKKKDESPPD